MFIPPIAFTNPYTALGAVGVASIGAILNRNRRKKEEEEEEEERQRAWAQQMIEQSQGELSDSEELSRILGQQQLENFSSQLQDESTQFKEQANKKSNKYINFLRDKYFSDDSEQQPQQMSRLSNPYDNNLGINQNSVIYHPEKMYNTEDEEENPEQINQLSRLTRPFNNRQLNNRRRFNY